MEHALATELADLGASAARPLDGLGPTVHEPTGFVVTLWHYIDHDPAVVGSTEACAEALVALHEALDATRTPVPSLLVELREARTALDDDDFIAELPHRERVVLREAFDEDLADLAVDESPVHRLHGEPHEANRLLTPAGVVWVDFESCCAGPREWKIAFLPPDAIPQFPQVDGDLLAGLCRLNHARLATWRWAIVRNHPDLRELAHSDLA